MKSSATKNLLSRFVRPNLKADPSPEFTLRVCEKITSQAIVAMRLSYHERASNFISIAAREQFGSL
jgi:hypothetical protein